jgi:hypothetical protein
MRHRFGGEGAKNGGKFAWPMMAHATRAYEQQLVENNGVYSLTIEPKRGADSFKPKSTPMGLSAVGDRLFIFSRGESQISRLLRALI